VDDAEAVSDDEGFVIGSVVCVDSEGCLDEQASEVALTLQGLGALQAGEYVLDVCAGG
jgi:hypothetical protein